MKFLGFVTQRSPVVFNAAVIEPSRNTSLKSPTHPLFGSSRKEMLRDDQIATAQETVSICTQLN